jgi:hypothetical protein
MTITVTRTAHYDAPCTHYYIDYAGQLIERHVDRRHVLRAAARNLHEWDTTPSENASDTDRAYVERRLRDGYMIVGTTQDGRRVRVAHVAADTRSRRAR